MAEASSTAPKTVQITAVMCTTHDAPVMSGCTACLKFFCPTCLNDEPWCSAVQGVHAFSVIEEVAKTIKSELPQNLKSVQKECDLLEEDGRAVLEELENEKKRLVESIDTELGKVIKYLQEVRNKSKQAASVTELLLKSDDASSFVHYSLPGINMPKITLKKGENLSVMIHTEEPDDDLQSKSLKYVSELTYEGEIQSLLPGGSVISMITHNRRMYNSLTGNKSIETDYKYQIMNINKGQLISPENNLVYEGRESLINVSGDRKEKITRDHNRSEFHITYAGNSKQQTINEDWCKTVKSVIWINQDEWILFFTKDTIQVYSSVNSPDYTFRKTLENNVDLEACKSVTPKTFSLCDNQFCFYAATKLVLYEFRSSSLSLKQKWTFNAVETERFAAGCYSQRYHKILLAVERGIIIIDPPTGLEVGRLETHGAVGEKRSIEMLSSFDDEFLFLVRESSYNKKKLLYYTLEGKTAKI